MAEPIMTEQTTFAELPPGARFIWLRRASIFRRDEFEVLVKTMFEFQIIEGGTRYNAVSTTDGNLLAIEKNEPVLPIAMTSKIHLISRKPFAYSPVSS